MSISVCGLRCSETSNVYDEVGKKGGRPFRGKIVFLEGVMGELFVWKVLEG